jgi:hypothetical protein
MPGIGSSSLDTYKHHGVGDTMGEESTVTSLQSSFWNKYIVCWDPVAVTYRNSWWLLTTLVGKGEVSLALICQAPSLIISLGGGCACHETHLPVRATYGTRQVPATDSLRLR